MAYIKEFTIHGLAGRKEPVRRQLDRHVNIFWGLNGTGKTSLLKILHSALRNQPSTLSRVPFESAEVVFVSTDHNVTLRRTFEQSEDAATGEIDATPMSELERITESVRRERTSEDQPRWKTKLVDGKSSRVSAYQMPFRHFYLPISRMNQFSSRQAYLSTQSGGVIDENFFDEDFADQVRRKWQAYNAEALASIRVIQQQGLAAILAQLFGGGTGTTQASSQRVTGAEAYELVRNFLREQGISLRVGAPEFLRRYEEQTDLRSVVANIQEVTSEVEQALRAQHDFQEVIGQLYSGGKRLVFDSGRAAQGSLRIQGDEGAIPLQSLSSGEKQLLRLMLETLAAEQSTVMIDEPELSMHVDWQQVLVASMQRVNPDCQLLLATHSPEIMADVPGKFVFEL